MLQPDCPACGVIVKVGANLRMGQRVVCQHCRTALRVVWQSPMELDWYGEEFDEEFDGRESTRLTKRNRVRRKQKLE